MAVVLRAFASGCTALTGVEAVSNGVPNFKKPKSRNAASTLAVMGGLDGRHVHRHHRAGPDDARARRRRTLAAGRGPAGYTQRTVIAQIAAAVFGNNSVGFFAVQAFTAAILVLAANTAFNGFPILASILGAGRVPAPPVRPARRPARVLATASSSWPLLAIALIVAFDASTTRLIQLYIIGVFVSFTLSQSGMVRHWRALHAARHATARRCTGCAGSLTVNAVGAVTTAVVLVIVLLTKFTHGPGSSSSRCRWCSS